MHHCIIALALSLSAKAQITEPTCNNLDSTATFEQLINCILFIDKSPARIPSRFLLENGYDYAVIDDLQGSLTPNNQVDYKRFILTYHSLYSSYLGGLNNSDIRDTYPIVTGRGVNPNNPIYHLPAPEKLDKTMERGSPNNPSAIRIGIGLIQYQQFREDALQLGWVNVITDVTQNYLFYFQAFLLLRKS